MIEDVTVIEGGWVQEAPVVILDAETARKGIASGELALLVHEALQALELSGQAVVFVKAAP